MQNYSMLIGWNTRHFFLITRALLANQEGLITWSWLAKRASAVSWFPAKMSVEKVHSEISWKFNASEFLMQLFHQLWKKIGMQEWMWKCGIEKELFNLKLFFPNRRKNIIWMAERCTKSGNSWRLSLKDKFFFLLRVVWYSKQKPPYRR